MKKWVLIGVAVVAVAAAGFYLWPRSQAAKSGEPEPTATVERGAIVNTVVSDGKVVSNLDVEIKCKASGEIVRLPFDVSQTVKKGELLVELDPVDEERSVRQAEANLASAEARLVSARESLVLDQANLATDRQRAQSAIEAAGAQARDARAKADRLQELLGRKLASPEESETAETGAVQAAAALEGAKIRLEELDAAERALELGRQQIRVAEAQVQGDRVALDVARQRLANTRVEAPMDGVVTARDVQVGQIISSPISNVGGGTTVLTLSDLTRMFVLAAVDEADIGRVQVGQPARVTVDAFPGKRFGGSVVRIAPRGVNVSNVVTFEVKIEVTSAEKTLLRPEMTANIEIVAARREDALLIPADAVVRKRGKSQVTVRMADGTKEDRVVETGIGDGQQVEITAGLVEGETVLVRKGEAESKWRGSNRGPLGMGRPH
ncbi:MAG TPA: efflux RND transporter periplasmic adaptor subunit [Deferrisomatales bacterium]|nr:efflux RND transporter periplasmic adaptor subunit [Deferrisomatales bacterium]